MISYSPLQKVVKSVVLRNRPSGFSKRLSSAWVRKKTHPKASDIKCCLLNLKLEVDSFLCLLRFGQPKVYSTAELKINCKLLSI